MQSVYNTLGSVLLDWYNALNSAPIPFMPGFYLSDLLIFPLLATVVLGAIKAIISYTADQYKQDLKHNSEQRNRYLSDRRHSRRSY